MERKWLKAGDRGVFLLKGGCADLGVLQRGGD